MRKLIWSYGMMNRWVILPNIEVRHEKEFPFIDYSTEVTLVWGKFFVSMSYE